MKIANLGFLTHRHYICLNNAEYCIRIFTTSSKSHIPSGIVPDKTILPAKTKPEYQKIVLKEDDIREIYSRSSGPGGQSVNKTNSRVQITHIPTGITIACQEQRDLQLNRRTARKKLIAELDVLANGNMSKKSKKIAKLQKRKSKARSRAKQKYTDSTKEKADEQLLHEEIVNIPGKGKMKRISFVKKINDDEEHEEDDDDDNDDNDDDDEESSSSDSSCSSSSSSSSSDDENDEEDDDSSSSSDDAEDTNKNK